MHLFYYKSVEFSEYLVKSCKAPSLVVKPQSEWVISWGQLRAPAGHAGSVSGRDEAEQGGKWQTEGRDREEPGRKGAFFHSQSHRKCHITGQPLSGRFTCVYSRCNYAEPKISLQSPANVDRTFISEKPLQVSRTAVGTICKCKSESGRHQENLRRWQTFVKGRQDCLGLGRRGLQSVDI